MTKILLVDDEEDILTSVKMILTKDGYDVKTVDRGQKALDVLKKETFDLVVLDILMPEMTGKEVAEKIRKNPKTKDQKIVFLTVIAASENVNIGIKALNPVDYIQKPITSADLRQRIKKVLAKQ